MLGSAVHPGDMDTLDCGRKGGWEKKEGGDTEKKEGGEGGRKGREEREGGQGREGARRGRAGTDGSNRAVCQLLLTLFLTLWLLQVSRKELRMEKLSCLELMSEPRKARKTMVGRENSNTTRAMTLSRAVFARNSFNRQGVLGLVE